MRKNRWVGSLLCAAALAGPGLSWAGQFEQLIGKPLSELRAAAPAAMPAVSGVRVHGRRWLIGVQPAVTAGDYRDEKAFEARISRGVEEALKASGARKGDEILVALPEYVGTWLIAVGENGKVYSAKTQTEAIASLLLTNPRFSLYLAVQAARRRHNPLDPDFVFSCLVHYKARAMWEAYRTASANVARRYGVTLVAGSILLPPLDRLGDDGAPLYNASFVFNPDGEMAFSTRKIYPTEAEQPFTASGDLGQLTVADLPFGRVGVMVCADGWSSAVFSRLKGAEVLVQPSFAIGGLPVFSRPWPGYDGQNEPADVDRRDVGRITERQAWRKYSLAGRMRSTKALAGINPFLSGSVWDVRTGGYGVAVDSRGRVVEQVTKDEADTSVSILVPAK